jgi:ubiquinone/menaquinone biosynthesis C-methylase UbiE
MKFADVPASYDALARDYEARFRDELDGKPGDRELLDAFGAAVDDPVVEIGCGPGQIGAYVRKRDRRVVGVDLSREMVARAGRRLDGALVADMRALPLAGRSTGGVLAFYSLIHVPRADLPVALREFRRVLRPGGRVLFSAHEGEGEVVLDEFIGRPVPMIATLFALDELVGACETVGLRVLHAAPREHYEGEITTRLYVLAARP